MKGTYIDKSPNTIVVTVETNRLDRLRAYTVAIFRVTKRRIKQRFKAIVNHL